MDTFEIINPGVLTTVQDLGRYGYQKFGLAVSGAVDQYSHQMANLIISNNEKAATLETNLVGLKLKVLHSTIICITGGDLQPKINGEPIRMWKSLKINKDDIISFTGCKTGLRSYLAVLGGINVKNVLGSKSTDILAGIGGINGRACMKGDVIKTNTSNKNVKNILNRALSQSLIPEYPSEVNIRVILGPQDDSFTESGISTFLSSTYTVGKEIDSMACRLEGPLIEHKNAADIHSEGLYAGAVQIPKNGQPIVFLHGRRSIGGYTKIASAISLDLPKLAQVKTGDKIKFRRIGIEEAQNLYKDEMKKIKLLRCHTL